MISVLSCQLAYHETIRANKTKRSIASFHVRIVETTNASSKKIKMKILGLIFFIAKMKYIVNLTVATIHRQAAVSLSKTKYMHVQKILLMI